MLSFCCEPGNLVGCRAGELGAESLSFEHVCGFGGAGDHGGRRSGTDSGTSKSSPRGASRGGPPCAATQTRDTSTAGSTGAGAKACCAASCPSDAALGAVHL